MGFYSIKFVNLLTSRKAQYLKVAAMIVGWNLSVSDLPHPGCAKIIKSLMQCRNATQLFSSSSFCIFENLTATYRTTKMAISQILDTLKGSRHGFRSAECLEFFSVWSSVQETFFGRCQPWFPMGETVCCRINPWNSWCRLFRGRRWDILFLQFRSFILFSF